MQQAEGIDAEGNKEVDNDRDSTTISDNQGRELGRQCDKRIRDGGVGKLTIERRPQRPAPYIQNRSKQSTIIQHASGLSIGIPRLSPEQSSKGLSVCAGSSTSSVQDSSNMAKQYQKNQKEPVSARILKQLTRSHGYYLSDVVKCEDNDQATRFAEYLQGKLRVYKRGFVLVSVDKDHVHVIHDCSFTNQRCRCKWFEQTEIVHGLRRRNRPPIGRPLCNSLGLTDVQNILKYFRIQGRKTIYLKVGGHVERLHDENSTMEVKGSEGCLPIGLADEGETSEEDHDLPLFGEEYLDQCTLERNRRGREAVARKKERAVGGKQVRRMEKMMTLFKNHPCSPVEGVLNHPVWLLDEDLKFLNGSDREVQSVINNWTKQLCTWSMEDFNVLYSEPDCKPLFGAGYNDVENYYYNVDDSVQIMDDLISYQCNDDDDLKYAFLSDLYNILERKKSKLNSILVYSPPSAGKNFFFDAIRDYFINVGYISKLNKFNSFPVQDAEGRRLIFFNEPNYSEDYIHTLKLLFGGDSTNVSVKYKKEAPIYRTPIIILTNNILTCMSDITFEDRTRIYTWKQAPYHFN